MTEALSEAAPNKAAPKVKKRLTDKGLKELYTLKQLETLNLADTGITDEGAKGLQAALPKLKIK